jgi:hypothetical protein
MGAFLLALVKNIIADLLLIRKINSSVSPASGCGDTKSILYV